MNIPIYTKYQQSKIDRSALLQAETKFYQQKTLAAEQSIIAARKATNAIMEMAKPKMTMNEELYSTGQAGYGSQIWQGNASEARRKSRIAHFESPPAQAMIGRFVDLVYGPKLELQAAPVWSVIPDAPTTGKNPDIESRQAIIKQIESRWRLWSKNVKSDYILEKNHHQQSRQNFEKLLIDGEYFCLLRYSQTRKRNPLTIQYIKPENIQKVNSSVTGNNTEENGIEYNSKGQAVAYHIVNILANGTRTSTRVPKFGIKSGRQFVIHNKLGSERRGVGILAGIITELTKLADFQALEIQAAVINALFAVVIETDLGGENKGLLNKSGISGINADAGEATRTNYSDFEQKLNSTQFQRGGNIVEGLGEGQKMKSFDTKRPTANFADFMKATLRNIFSAKGMSYDVAMFDPESSYSAIRTNLLILWNRVMTLRYDHSCDYEDVIYRAWMWGEVDNGKIKINNWQDEEIQDAWINATWTGPTRPDIDPLRSFKAHEGEVDEGFKTNSQVTAERGGGDWDENIERLKIENELKADARKDLVIQDKTSFSNSTSKTESTNKTIETGGK